MVEMSRFWRQKSKIVIMLGLLVFALWLRMPQLNFPSVGYHNMKENEYISMAKQIIKKKDLNIRDVYFYNAFKDKKDFDLYPQVPFVAYQIVIGYKLFGDNLWFPRLINIFWMLLSILLIFYLTRLLTSEDLSAFLSAFLLAIMPLGVFFSRNLQPESAAFFFMMLGSVCWIKYMDKWNKGYLFGFALSLAITAAYKMAFIIGFIPLLMIFPYSRYFSKRNRADIFITAGIIWAPVFVLIAYFFYTGQMSFPSCQGRVSFFRPFFLQYWKDYGSIIWHYIKNENYTLIYFILFLGGVFASWLNFRSDKSLFIRYLRGWSIMIIIYFMVFNDYLNQHNYYQMPFLGFVCLSILHAIKRGSLRLGVFLGASYTKKIFIFIFVLVFLVTAQDIRKAIKSQFSVIFPGTDYAGLYLKGITSEDEKFFYHAFCQGYAAAVYAERRCGWPGEFEEFKKIEEKEKISFVMVYPINYLNSIPETIRAYIFDNYHVNAMGFTSQGENLAPCLIIFKKGGKTDIKDFINTNQQNVKVSMIYKTINGNLPFYFMRER